MIRYFKDLLKTLKEINENLKKIENQTGDLSDCVKNNSHRHGARRYIVTGHWNDG